MTQPIVIKNLSKSFSGQPVLKNLSLTVEANESLVIIGRSGCGKSVLVKCILGLIPFDSGTISLYGVDIGTAKRSKIARVRKNVGMLFQNGALFDSMTVAENILFPVQTRKIATSKLGAQNNTELVINCLERVGLDASFLSARPSDLSGGQRKRVGLARAIATAPRLLFFDEPTTGLDPVMSDAINALLKFQTKGLEATAVTITHDMGTVESIASRVVLLDRGHLVWSGDQQAMRSADDPLLKRFLDYRGAA